MGFLFFVFYVVFHIGAFLFEFTINNVYCANAFLV